MLKVTFLSIVVTGASLMTLPAKAVHILAPANHSESGSLVIFGLGLLAASVFARRLPVRS